MKSGTLHSYITNLGFERAFGQYMDGSPHCLSVCSASMGLFAAFKTLGVQNGEVIVSSINWPGALWFFDLLQLTPVIADIDLNTYTLSTESVSNSISDKTVAILATDMFGYPCDWLGLRTVADNKELPLIADCAQSLGAMYHHMPSGVLADIAVFSFGVGKEFSLGEGGMIYCQTAKTFEKLLVGFAHPDIQKIHLGKVKSHFSANIRLNPEIAQKGINLFESSLLGVVEKRNRIHTALGHNSKLLFMPNYRKLIRPKQKAMGFRFSEIPEEYLLTKPEASCFPKTYLFYQNYIICHINH